MVDKFVCVVVLHGHIQCIFSEEKLAVNYVEKMLEELEEDLIEDIEIKKCKLDAASVLFGLFIYGVMSVSDVKDPFLIKISEYYFDLKPEDFNKVICIEEYGITAYTVYVRADSKKEAQEKGVKLINEYKKINKPKVVVFGTGLKYVGGKDVK
jgi:hypothetical protein